jgi:hypothetical protein
VFVALATNQRTVGTTKIEADDLVVKQLRVTDASLRERQPIDELKLAPMVLAVTRRTRRSLPLGKRTVQAFAIPYLRRDVFMALIARRLHVAKPATVTSSAGSAAVDFGKGCMHGRDRPRRLAF